MNKIEVSIWEDEYWYAAEVTEGINMPFNAESDIERDIRVAGTENQTSPFLISTKGRYIWSKDGFVYRVKKGKIKCKNSPMKHDIEIFDGYRSLKGAYLNACARFFPPDGKHPNELMFRYPQYCTWIALGAEQTEEGIIDYAKSIVDSGMPVGELIIDDGWQENFGSWDFDAKKVPHPKALVKTLHEMGFKVILWICPFVSRDAIDYDYLKYGDLLVKKRSGKIAFRKWWNGKDALIDMSNPSSREWFKSKCDYLMNEYGVDGFKQDAGDAFYYKDSDITYNAVDANTESKLWCESARSLDFNEIRACFKCGGMGIAQRLCDKRHSFTGNGLEQLVPNALMQGILGYPYSCPDMIGGGAIGDFRGRDESEFDMELFVRYAQASALMPMMQYSFPVWKLKNKRIAELCKEAAAIHEEYSDYIMKLVKTASRTGEPIVRYLAYEFPHEEFEKVNDMFMLGDKYLVAPVTVKGQYEKEIRLPEGHWKYVDGNVYSGTVTVGTPIEILPVFERLDEENRLLGIRKKYN